MHKKFFIFCLFVMCLTIFGEAQNKHFINVETKEWYRDSAREIHYKDWKAYPSLVVDSLEGFKQISKEKLDKFGGVIGNSSKATGFFRVEKINNRWWIIDPQGNRFINVAMNAVRTGKSPNNQAAFDKRFGTIEKWIGDTKFLFDSLGVNVAGSWSDVKTITAYNKTAKKPLVYTTQLSLLANYRRHAIKENPERKKEAEMSFVFDTAFKTYSAEELKKLDGCQNDPNLLGHFSDNEIPFTENEVAHLLEVPANAESYNFLQRWFAEKGYDEHNLTKEQKKELIGLVTKKYFETVYTVVKNFDPNHLYIGSRLHSSAKNNEYIFKAAEPFIDIVSINYYGYWEPTDSQMKDWAAWSSKPYFITEFYTKAEESGMANTTGAGWLVRTFNERGIHYQNFCLKLLKDKNCVGWHWFKYQDNDPNDPNADPSNKDSNKGLINNEYQTCLPLAAKMKQLNDNKYSLVKYLDAQK